MGRVTATRDYLLQMSHRLLFVELLKESREKLKRYASVPALAPAGPSDAEGGDSALKSLLTEAVEEVDRLARRQGSRRMVGRSFGDGFRANPNRGAHYPAVQSFLDRARNALARAD